MLDRYAKEKYQLASSLLDDINGEDIRELLLKVTIENARVNIFKAVSDSNFTDNEDNSLLEKLAKALLIRLIFTPDLEKGIVEGAALVCAQAYETLSPPSSRETNYSIDNPEFLNRSIAAMLYFISGYDPNAAHLTKGISEFSFVNNETSIEYIVMKNLASFIALEHRAVVQIAPLSYLNNPSNFSELDFITREALLWSLNDSIYNISNELLYYHSEWNLKIIDDLLLLYNLSIDCGQNTIALLSLVLVLVSKSFSTRAMSVLPKPDDCELEVWKAHMQRYINEGKYLIWIPHREAVQKGLLLPQNDIIAIPTGTGKSLIAEHKIISSLQRGRVVIYLAPTLALCRQISSDVKKLLNVQNRILGQSIIIDDIDNFDFDIENDTKLILVMTPEKCSVLLVNVPELFTSCTLCVVDEFHNINDGQRGALLDTLLARLSEQAPNAVFLLLSALIAESEVLPRWLKGLNGRKVEHTYIRWRPSRTLRGFISHPSSEYNRAINAARKSQKKTSNAEIPVDLFFCVQDVWSPNQQKSAYPIRIPEKFKIRFVLKNGRTGPFWTTEGYGNDIARQLGNWLASCNMPVLIFSQTTRHLMSEIKNHKQLRAFVQEPNKKVKSYLKFAEEELGFISELEAGLHNGIGIHTQAVIEEEQLAVEEFFKTCSEGVICATGTLAQGLNLPASAVVVNTTKQHNSGSEAPKAMSKSEVINMLGRAGRPGLGFQSIGMIVPQYPSTHGANGFQLENEYIDYLERIDAIIPVGSGLKNIIESLAISQNESDSDNFLFMINSSGNEQKINKKIISKSLAGNLLEEIIVDQAIMNCNKWIDQINIDENKREILEIANKSNTTLEIVYSLIDSIDETQTIELLSMAEFLDVEWINWLVGNIMRLPQDFFIIHVHELLKTPLVLSEFIRRWMSGESVLQISRALYELGLGKTPVPQKRDSQTSIAKTIHLIQDAKRNIVHLTNCYIAIIEMKILKFNPTLVIPHELKTLSQYINYGVNSYNALRFRKRGLPRNAAIKLGEYYTLDSIDDVIRSWKENSDNIPLFIDDHLKDAIITLI